MRSLMAGRLGKSLAAVLFAALVAGPVALALADNGPEGGKKGGRRARASKREGQPGRRGESRPAGPLARMLSDEKLQALFTTLDKDTDGKLTVEEFKGLRDALEAARKEAMAQRRAEGGEKKREGAGKGRGEKKRKGRGNGNGQ